MTARATVMTNLRKGFRRRYDGKVEDGTCWNCLVSLTGRKRRYCSNDCALSYWGRFSWQNLRLQAFKRDKYTCQLCGYKKDIWEWYKGDIRLECDHIVPIADGGNEFDIANVRTLCSLCHKKVTREWHARGKNGRKNGAGIQLALPLQA